MEFQSHAVASHILHHCIAVLFHMVMDGLAHVSQISPWLHLLESLFHRFPGDAHQLLLFRSHIPDHKHTGGIGIIAVEDGGHIHVDDIALL